MKTRFSICHWRNPYKVLRETLEQTWTLWGGGWPSQWKPPRPGKPASPFPPNIPEPSSVLLPTQKTGAHKIKHLFSLLNFKKWTRRPAALLPTVSASWKSFISSFCVLLLHNGVCEDCAWPFTSRPEETHHCCSQSIGQTQRHGPYLPGNCRFFCAPGRGKGIGGLLTSLGHSCLRDIFDISTP